MTYAFIFAGQGSQKLEMGKKFQQHPIYNEIFAKANKALGYNLQKICNEGPVEKLTLSKNAQPAILSVATIAHRIFTSHHSKIRPSFMAGHSLGEYSALVAADVLDFSDAIKIVHRRGELMQQAVPEGLGAMAAIFGKKEQDLCLLCKEISTNDSKVSPANYNSDGQIVVSGHKTAVTKLLAKTKGKLLQVSAPFHCSLMSSIKQKFSEYLAEFSIQKANIPIINNVNNEIQKSNFTKSLLQQIDHPVLWKSGIKLMISKGVTNFIEFGEGTILTSLCKKINKEVLCKNINTLESIIEFKK